MAAVKIRNRQGLIFTGLLFLTTLSPATAQWLVGKHPRPGSDRDILMAHSRNEEGYDLAVFRDADRVVARFSLPQGTLALAEKICPTYQIDKGTPDNQSYDKLPCSGEAGAAEFVLGQISSGTVQSSLLLTVLNGNSILFRFRLSDGSYRETRISLAGSKRAMTDAIGHDIAIRAPG